MRNFNGLTELEAVVFQGMNLAHEINNLRFNGEDNSITIIVEPCRSELGEREYRFEGVTNFKYELEEGERLDDYPKPIIGMDFYDKNGKEFNTVINCGDVEFTFLTDSLPKAVIQGEC